MARLLGAEKNGDRTDRYWLHSGDGGKDLITVETVQDIEPILEANKRAYRHASQKFGKGDYHKVADIPAVVIEEIIRIKRAVWPDFDYREFMQNKSERAQKVWNELLNSPEFRAFRTRPGHVEMKRR